MEKNTKCIIVLGGGIGKKGKLPEWSLERCKVAVEYYFNFKHMYDLKFIVTSGGTYHQPNPLDKLGFTIFEADLMSNYLLNSGIPENSIFREYSSYDTIGNGFFVRTLFTDIRRWKDLVVITSDFHMNRSKEIFNFIFTKLASNYKLEYISCKNIISNNLNDRIIKEENSKLKFINDMKKIYNLNMFHKWLYSTHECYKTNPKEKKLPEKNLLYY